MSAWLRLAADQRPGSSRIPWVGLGVVVGMLMGAGLGAALGFGGDGTGQQAGDAGGSDAASASSVLAAPAAAPIVPVAPGNGSTPTLSTPGGTSGTEPTGMKDSGGNDSATSDSEVNGSGVNDSSEKDPPAGAGGAAAGVADGVGSCPPATLTVSTAEELHAALARAGPGDSLRLAPGRYSGRFVATTTGSGGLPIWLCGPRDAVLDGGDVEDGYVLHLEAVQHWRLEGFTVRNGQKGVMLDATSHTMLRGLLVEQIGDEAIHLRRSSSFNTVQGNTVRQTGLRRDKYGEGIYVGSASSNWATVSGGQPDRSDHNLVSDNTISGTTAEAIDIKEGTSGGIIRGNMLDGTGVSAADSLIDLKGNGWLVEGNHVTNGPVEAVQTHRILDDWGRENVLSANVLHVVGQGRHIYIHDPTSTANRVLCDNRTPTGEPVRSNVGCVG